MFARDILDRGCNRRKMGLEWPRRMFARDTWIEAVTGGKWAWSGRDGGLPGTPWIEAITGRKWACCRRICLACNETG